MEKEIWRNIVGYENLYKVSTMGRVKSLKWGKEKFLKPEKNRNGYLRVVLCKDGKCKHFRVHRLVAEAFIPNDGNLPCINHKDEDKTNNRVENLEWCSVSYNNNYNDGQKRRAEKNTNGKKSKPVIALDPKTGMVAAEFPSMMEAQRRGYNAGTISDCCHDKLKTHKGLIWCYKGTSDEEIDRRIAELLLCGKTPKERAAKTKSKPVIALDPNTGMVVAEFQSTMEAGRNGFSHGHISLCCRGKRKSHKGLIWRYKEAS